MWWTALFACSPESPVPTGPIRSVELVRGDATAPAAAELVVKLDEPMSLEVAATDGEHPFTISRPPAIEHRVPLIGLYASRGWTVTGTAIDSAGVEHPLPLRTIWTPSLPEPFPELRVRSSDPQSMEPGLTLFPVTSASVTSTLVLVDAAGEVAWWYHPPEPRVLEARVLADGNLLLMWDYAEIREIDWLGRVVRSVSSQVADRPTTPVALEKFHHELFEADDGSWITLTTEGRYIPHFPRSYDSPLVFGPANVEVEPIASIDPDSGAVLAEWRPDLVLDPARIGYDSLVELAGHRLDWSHTNAVADGGDWWIVSLRHQDAVLALDKATGEIAWILSNADNWGPAWEALRLRPVGDVRWPYHQHAVKWSSDGRLLMFDNGNRQASPWTDEPELPDSAVSSRVVQYKVDVDDRTVAQDWSFDLDPPVFSHAMGDADWLTNGDVLGVWAYATYEDGVANEALGRGSPSVRVVEFDPSDGRVVWDLEALAPVGAPAPDWHSYRAERVPPMH